VHLLAQTEPGHRQVTSSSRSTSRIVGLDVARGVAVLGMFAAHLAYSDDSLNLFIPGSWIEVSHGRSSILFAVLAGVSMAILSGRTSAFQGAELANARARILVRAVLLFALGSVLDTFGSDVAVILEYYAVLFVLALPFLSWRPRRLFLLAGALAVVMPGVHHVAAVWLEDQAWSTLGDLLVTGTYPVLIWIVFPLVGLGVGRLDLTAARVRGALLAAGVGLAVAGYGIGAVAEHVVSDGPAGVDMVDVSDESWDEDSWEDDEFDGEEAGFDHVDLRLLAGSAPHSGTPFEVIGSTGVALGVIALCLVIADRLRWLVFPLAATGSMALTVYCAHVIALAFIGDSVYDSLGNLLYLWFVLVTLAVASIWKLTLGRGPLERLLTWTSHRTAGGTKARKS
jgi:uncharacterized membrane protein YeiB